MTGKQHERDQARGEDHGRVAAVDVELQGSTPVYQPPRVESVLSADDLEREILYAGIGGSVVP